MDITRQYIRQFLNESKKPARKFEASGYKYAYTTKDRAEDGGWEVQNSIKKLEANWDDEYGELDLNNVLVMKPATSVDKAMVWIAGVEGDFICPSIDAAINGPEGLYALGWKEGATLATITEEEVRELLQTKDLKRVEELLNKAFVDSQDYGYFEGLYEYVSGPMPKEDGRTPGKTLVKNKKQKVSKDFEYYRIKVLANPENLGKVPDEFKTPELCELAMKRDVTTLKYVPDKFKTQELCRTAVEKNGLALQGVPNKFKTSELCKIAVEDYGYALNYVPDKFKTSELCELAIKDNGLALQGVPDKLITPELCKIAVEDRGIALKYVPDKFKTSELCELAVEHDERALQFIPDELKTPEICKRVLERWGVCLQFVPDKLKTLEMCKIAVKSDRRALQFVPDHLKEQVKQELGIK